MAKCPLCNERPSKRYCPAKEAQICSLCCGTKREIEIDCPSTCVYLKAAHSYEKEKRIPDQEASERALHYDENFIYRFSPIFDAVTALVLQERAQSPWFMDLDLIEVYKSLIATLKTLSGGIYYESIPESPIRASLYRQLKTLFDDLMNPQPETGYAVLKLPEAIEVLGFLVFVAEAHSSIRPRSRKCLDWMAERVGPPAGRIAGESGGLIIP